MEGLHLPVFPARAWANCRMLLITAYCIRTFKFSAQTFAIAFPFNVILFLTVCLYLPCGIHLSFAASALLRLPWISILLNPVFWHKAFKTDLAGQTPHWHSDDMQTFRHLAWQHMSVSKVLRPYKGSDHMVFTEFNRGHIAKMLTISHYLLIVGVTLHLVNITLENRGLQCSIFSAQASPILCRNVPKICCNHKPLQLEWTWISGEAYGYTKTGLNCN